MTYRYITQWICYRISTSIWHINDNTSNIYSWQNMVKMIGNCGYAFSGTFKWPNCPGDYHFKDTECEFNCLQTEYFYWMLTSILGAQDGPPAPERRCKKIPKEWELCNKEKVLKKYNPLGYKLTTDEKY